MSCGSATIKPGGETARQLPGGAQLAQAWDTTGRLAAQTLTSAPTAGMPQRVLQRRGYQYRADGAIVGLDDLPSGSRRLTLDPTGRATG
jgi:YD repeat-containing protein